MINRVQICLSLALIILVVDDLPIEASSINVTVSSWLLASSSSALSSKPPLFVPKVTESPQPQDLENDYYDDDWDNDNNNGNNNNNLDPITIDITGGGNGGVNGPNGGGEDLDLNDLLAAASERGRRRNNGSSSVSATTPPSFTSITANSSDASRRALSPLFDFVEFVLKATSPNENIVEAKIPQKSLNDNEVDDSGDDDESDYDHEYDDIIQIHFNNSNLTTNFDYRLDEELSWQQKENVCVSKVVYEKEGKSKFEYWLVNSCKEKHDSEFCLTKVQAGLKGFEIHSVTSCCPNFRLNESANECQPDLIKPDLLELLKTYMSEINSTVQIHLSSDIKHRNDRIKFTREFNQIHADIIMLSSGVQENDDSSNNNIKNYNDARQISNSTRLTVFLWDQTAMLEHVRGLLTSTLASGMWRRLEQILDTIRYHMGKMHYSTHSFYSKTIRMESRVIDKPLRLSYIQQENTTSELVNCREIFTKNQYHQRIDESKHPNYRLLMHQLEPGSLLVPQQKTVFQLLNDKLSRSARLGADATSRFTIFAKIFAKCRDLLQEELSSSLSSSSSVWSSSKSATSKLSSFGSGGSGASGANGLPLTVFIPMDSAFRSLRRDQIESLWSDSTCAYKFVMQNVVREEICPNQMIRLGAEYSSRVQKADFIAVPEENATTHLYFNGQKVNSAKSYPASNGVVYRLATLELAGVVDFLYDIVIGFRRRFAHQFIESLKSNWLDELKNESRNVTLFMPFETTTILTTTTTTTTTNPVVSKNISSVNNSTNNSSSNGQAKNVSIRDYLVRPRLTFYDLNDGDLITSLSGRRMLISVYPFEGSLSEVIMRFIPRRNLDRKAINCQQLEVPDLSACNAQLIVFKSTHNRIPDLNSNSILEFIQKEPDLSIFNSLLRFCGANCTNLLSNLSSQDSSSSSSSSARRRGYSGGVTILLPVNDYFNKALFNFQKFSNNISLFKSTIKANIFRGGTYCGFFMRNDVHIENMLGRKVRTKRLLTRIQTPDVYLSHTGLVAHKTNLF